MEPTGKDRHGSDCFAAVTFTGLPQSETRLSYCKHSELLEKQNAEGAVFV